jgi:hypothetical protein
MADWIMYRQQKQNNTLPLNIILDLLHILPYDLG